MLRANGCTNNSNAKIPHSATGGHATLCGMSSRAVIVYSQIKRKQAVAGRRQGCIARVGVDVLYFGFSSHDEATYQSSHPCVGLNLRRGSPRSPAYYCSA